MTEGDPKGQERQECGFDGAAATAGSGGEAVAPGGNRRKLTRQRGAACPCDEGARRAGAPAPGAV